MYELLRSRVIVSIPGAAEQTGLTFPTTRDALLRLESLGIVREVSGRARNRFFAYDRYLDLVDEGVPG